jgi:hypothetical protein
VLPKPLRSSNAALRLGPNAAERAALDASTATSDLNVTPGFAFHQDPDGDQR